MVVGLVDRGDMIRTRVVPTTDRDFLQGIVHLNVKTGSTVVTDAHRGYVRLKDTYNHISI